MSEDEINTLIENTLTLIDIKLKHKVIGEGNLDLAPSEFTKGYCSACVDYSEALRRTLSVAD